MTADAPPLRGVTVVSLEQAVAVSFATRQLVDLGARVIKIERPGGVDVARGYDELFASEAAMEIALDAVRVRGGYGYSTEFDVERYFADAR